MNFLLEVIDESWFSSSSIKFFLIALFSIYINKTIKNENIISNKLDINIRIILIKKLNKNEIKIIIVNRTNNNLPKEILIRY